MFIRTTCRFQPDETASAGRLFSSKHLTGFFLVILSFFCPNDSDSVFSFPSLLFLSEQSFQISTMLHHVLHSFFLAGKGYDPTGNNSDYSAFMEWLQCYYNPEMRNVVDHDGRTMWFKLRTWYLLSITVESQ